MRIREIQNLLTNKGFNPYIDITNPDRVLIHLLEESGEITKVHRKLIFNNEHSKIIEMKKEIGDLFILLCFYASSVHVDLQSAIFDKITENIQKGKFGLKEYKKETLENLDKLFEERR